MYSYIIGILNKRTQYVDKTGIKCRILAVVGASGARDCQSSFIRCGMIADLTDGQTIFHSVIRTTCADTIQS